MEGMLSDFFFVDVDSQTGKLIGGNCSRHRVDRKAFLNNVVSPRHVIADRFADNVARL